MSILPRPVQVCFYVSTTLGSTRFYADEEAHSVAPGDVFHLTSKYHLRNAQLLCKETQEIVPSRVNVASEGHSATLTSLSALEGGKTLQVKYQVCVPGTALSLHEDRGDPTLNRYRVRLADDVEHRDIYTEQHRWAQNLQIQPEMLVTGDMLRE